MKLSRFFTVITLCLCLALGAVLGGCADKLGRGSSEKEPKLVIPDFPAAREQFQFAKMYQEKQLLVPEIKRRRIQVEKIEQCYQTVLKNFPNDKLYVPLTYLELGDCEAQANLMDSAIKYYQQAQSVSDEEFIDARALFSMGRVYDAQGRYVEAKKLYKTIIDTYQKSESGKVLQIVKHAGGALYDGA